MARILKNMREKLKDKNLITPDVAPSYYLEGLLYNVPNEDFGTSYHDCVRPVPERSGQIVERVVG